MVLLVLLTAGLIIDGVEDGILEWQGSDPMLYEVSVSFDNGDSFSDWIPYPERFNGAKLFCSFNSDDNSIEVVSQLPYTAEYTYAQYAIDDDGNLSLLNHGLGGYYSEMTAEIKDCFLQGDFQGACSLAYDIMYPGSMPDADDLCALFVIEAAEVGTLEAFSMADDISRLFHGLSIYQIQSTDMEYLSALKIYSELADPETAQLVLERLGNHE